MNAIRLAGRGTRREAPANPPTLEVLRRTIREMGERLNQMIQRYEDLRRRARDLTSRRSRLLREGRDLQTRAESKWIVFQLCTLYPDF
jgi:phage shock protein A